MDREPITAQHALTCSIPDRSSRWSLSAFLLGVDNKLPDFSTLIGPFNERAVPWLAAQPMWQRGTAIDRSQVTRTPFWPVVGGPCLVQFDTAYLDVKRSACLEMLDSEENSCQLDDVRPPTTLHQHSGWYGQQPGSKPWIASFFLSTSLPEQSRYSRQFEYLNNRPKTKPARSLSDFVSWSSQSKLSWFDEYVPNGWRFAPLNVTLGAPSGAPSPAGGTTWALILCWSWGERGRVLKHCHQSPGQEAPAPLSIETSMLRAGARVPRYKAEFKPATIGGTQADKES